MKRILMFLFVLSIAITPSAFSQANQNDVTQPAGPAQAHIQKEVRHELLMLPYFGVFDNIAFQVNGGTVTLLGAVTRPTLKSDAEIATPIEKTSNVVDGGLCGNMIGHAVYRRREMVVLGIFRKRTACSCSVMNQRTLGAKKTEPSTWWHFRATTAAFRL